MGAERRDVVARGRVYYGKLLKGQATFLSRQMIPVFNAIWGISKGRKKNIFQTGRTVLKMLRKEWEMATADLRAETKLNHVQR